MFLLPLLLRRGFARTLFRQESRDLPSKVLSSRRIIISLHYYRVTSIPKDIQVRVDPRRTAAVPSHALSFNRLIHESVSVLCSHRGINFAARQFFGQLGTYQL